MFKSRFIKQAIFVASWTLATDMKSFADYSVHTIVFRMGGVVGGGGGETKPCKPIDRGMYIEAIRS